MITIIKFFIESKVPMRNFSVLSRYLRAQSPIDTFRPSFHLIGAQKRVRLWGFEYILVTSNPSKRKSSILPREQGLCAGLQFLQSEETKQFHILISCLQCPSEFVLFSWHCGERRQTCSKCSCYSRYRHYGSPYLPKVSCLYPQKENISKKSVNS